MSEVSIVKNKMTIPTYIPPKANVQPMFFENKPYQGASGKLYPLPYSDGISDEKTDVDYEAYTLENQYIKTVVLPELGGKILRGYDKVGDYDFIYYNEVVKPALVGLAGAWISGGIEFNWPQHHRPTTFMPLEAAMEEGADGSKTVWVGEVEPFNRMKGMAGIAVDKDRSYIKAKIRVYNRTNQPQPFMWWANLAVPVNDDYVTVFPPDCEWVNDHDRRAVLEWPIAKGVFNTARPYDFGEGTDISKYNAIKVPSSYLISQGQTDMDFIAGYDNSKKKGIATVANHHISPGKKMWHWGTGDFGNMWCSNLTDENGPYIELMTGVYTDNQPDFTWIAPYETREFEQYWYPIRDIGEPKCATIDAAINLEKQADNIFIGLNVTGIFNSAKLVLKENGKVISEEILDLTPEKAFVKTISADDVDFQNLKAELLSSDNKVLVEYTPYKRGQKSPIDPRLSVKRPCEYETVEELYINGYHLEQYKQHNYKAEDYYLEGLKRDSGDIRCNTSMARLKLKYGEFEKAIEYCDKAIERLTSRNEHPSDTEAFYIKGLSLKYLGKNKEAYDILYKSAWNYTHRSASYFELAELDCKLKNYDDALRKLDISIGLNAGHTKAKNLKTAILRKIDKDKAEASAKESLNDDILDLFAMIEASHFENQDVKISEFLNKSENLIDVAADYINCGFYEDAIYVLDMDKNNYPLVKLYKAYCLSKLDREFKDILQEAENCSTDYCCPARLDDIAILKFAIENYNAANLNYYLGCLYFDRFRYDEAILCFEKSISIDPKHAKAYRNLSLLYFDKKDDFLSAKHCIEKAIEYMPDDPRLLLEYQQLLKNIDTDVDTRLKVYDEHEALLEKRDDCYLDKIVLLCLKGEYKKAIDMAANKRFHIYEGGEGKLTDQHAWMHVLYGLEFLKNNDLQNAEKAFENGINMPKSYGEAKTFFNQEAHIYYFLGITYERMGEQEKAKEAFNKATVFKAAISEISLFRALAFRKVNEYTNARSVLEEMLEKAEDIIKNKDRRSYYGVGSPSPMPFEYNVEKQNLRDGYILKAYALYGLGKFEEAECCMKEAEIFDKYDFRIYAYRQIIKGEKVCKDTL